jgi:predicted RecB family nuclease
MPSLPITAAVLYDLVHCPRRVALDAFGDPSKRDKTSPFVQLLWERGSAYEKGVIAGLKIPFVDLSKLEATEREARTLEAMRNGEPLIYGGRIAADGLLGVPDLLRKSPGGYIPGDIKSGSGEEAAGDDDSDAKPKKHYAVQLALYVDILERLGLSAGRRAFVWDVHGKEVVYDLEAPLGPHNPESLWDFYQDALAAARAILDGHMRPRGAYASICKHCHWYSHCLKELTAADDLTLIPGLGRRARDNLGAHFSTIAELAKADPDALLQGMTKTHLNGVGPDALRKFIERARLLKDPSGQPYLKGPLALPVTPLELFFDVEVDPMRDVCYLHGVLERRDRDNGSERFVAFFAEAPTPEAEKDAFARAYAYLRAAQPAVIYYYSRYERTIYRKLQARYPEVCSADDIEVLFDPTSAIDMYSDVVARLTEWPTRDHSIKTLATYLGFSWRDTNPSGAASIEWFHRWTQSGNPAVKQRILAYNEDDCRATRVLLDGIRALTPFILAH